MDMKRLLLVAALFSGCSSVAPLPPVSPPSSDVRYPEYPQLSAHCRTCPQCSKPLMDEDGNENSICEEGFRLMQDDMRNAAR